MFGPTWGDGLHRRGRAAVNHPGGDQRMTRKARLSVVRRLRLALAPDDETAGPAETISAFSISAHPFDHLVIPAPLAERLAPLAVNGETGQDRKRRFS